MFERKRTVIVLLTILLFLVTNLYAGWTRTYGGRDWDVGRSVQQTSDEGCIIVGETNSSGAGSEDVYLIKTDASGNAVWTKTFGGTSYDYGRSVQQTSDGGYIFTGETRTYGGGDEDYGYSVQQTNDAGYIVAGYTYSFGAGDADVYLIKTNANETSVEETVNPTTDNFTYSIYQISDNNIFFVILFIV